MTIYNLDVLLFLFGISLLFHIVLSEEQAQDGTFRIPQFGLALNAREGPGSVTYKCSELQGRVSQLWPCWQFGLDNSSGAVPYTAL